MMRIALLIIFCCSLDGAKAQNKVVAFPGAEGFGKYTTGGRGGKVIIVTNLNDDGPGSLRKAIQVKEPRIIVFAVSGNIELASPLNISYGNVTIAGQSAPGYGICIKNYGVNVSADNVIIRFMRFRLGDEKKYEGDAIGGTKGSTDIIIDHCSMSWSTDECASFYRNRNFSMQWCIVSESLNSSVHVKGEHGYGGIWGGMKASFHHNLIASHNSRLPRFSGSSTTPNPPDELVDFRNNVIYNWMSNNTYGGEKGRYNMVNNYYKPGPATKKTRLDQIVNPSSPLGKFYIAGNYLYGNAGVSADNRMGVKVNHLDSVFAEKPFETEALREQSAEQAYKLVLAGAGASFRRDAVDVRVVEEVRTGKSLSGKNKNGIIDSPKDVGGWPQLVSLPAPADADQDGMPDAWETGHGLNPNDPADATRQTVEPGYDNVEAYLNSLVKGLAQTPATKVTTNAPWSVRMTDSEMIRNPSAWSIDFVTTPKWNYTPGLVCSAVERLWKKTGDEKYYNYIKTYADDMINEDGTIKTYKPEEYNIDKVNPGKFLFALYAHTGNEKYAKAIRLMRDQMRTHPRTSEGGFWHKKIYPHQMWLDGIYMGSPFLAQYAKVFNEPALFDDVALQIRLIEKYTYDEKLGLYYHAWDESKAQEWANKETGRSPHVWGRAMGWYAMALVDVLDFFPQDHPGYKEILNSVQKVADAIVRYQDRESGLWYQVVDQGKREGNYLEGSASSMYAYFLLKAVTKGYIDKKYLAHGEQAYKGILDRLIKVEGNGMVSITQVCAVAGLGGNPYRDGTYEYYINEKKRDNDPKAVGPFIMASLLFEER